MLLGPGAPLWTSIVLSGAIAEQLVEGPGASWEGSEVEARREEAEEAEELAGCKCTLSEVVGTTERSSSSTVRSTTSLALCLRGWMTVERRWRPRPS